MARLIVAAPGMGSLLREPTDAELRAYVRSRGYELHSQQYSQSVGNMLREIDKMRTRFEQMERDLKGLKP